MRKLKLFSLLMLLLVGLNQVWADAYTHSFTGSTTSPFTSQSAGTTQQVATLTGISWTINTATAASFFSQSTTDGLQIGSKNNPSGNFTLTTTALSSYTITKIEVTCKRASNSSAQLSASVGSNALGTQNQSLGTSSGTLTFSNATGYKGNVVLSFNNPSVNNRSTAVYITQIKITYSSGSNKTDLLFDPS